MRKPGDVPEYVEYRRYALQGRTIDGTVPLIALPRVVAVVQQSPGADDVARLRLAFVEDGQRRVRAEGQITARLLLRCERCLTSFEHGVDAPIAGVIVANDANAATVPKADEPIMADGDTLDVHTLAEDELLLALPMAAYCDKPECQAGYNDQSAIPHAQEPQPRQRRDNPFAVLKQIKNDRDT